MAWLEIIFWLTLFIIFYSYIGYGLLVWLVLKIKGPQVEKPQVEEPFEPMVTLMVAAYNEKDVIAEKVQNCRELDYPENKIKIVFVTDGSDDGTPEIANQFDDVTVHHKEGRGGKVGALNRGMTFVDTPFVIFSDANTMFNKDAVREIIKHYKDPQVGAVSGEKRVKATENVTGAGESLYWKYESTLKRMDSDLYSIVGAAGEMFSIRADLYENLEPDTILDDFMISLRINKKGYRVVYEPNAYAEEAPSSSILDEWKRKVRISAGGFQSIARLKDLYNIFRFGLLSFEFVSHRVLRWAFDPFALVALIPINFILTLTNGGIYTVMMWLQVLFYAAAGLGWYMEERNKRIKLLYVPFYFTFMNAAALAGWKRFRKGQQSAIWERVGRA